MRKKINYLIAMVLIIAVAFTFSACGSNPGTEGDMEQVDELEARTAIIFQIDSEAGGVYIIRDQVAYEGYEGMRVTGGDEVTVDSNAIAYLRVDNDKNILINSDSILDIIELKTGQLLLKLVKGQFFCDVQNKLADDETMSFETGGVTMSVRGTSFGATFEGTHEDVNNQFKLEDGNEITIDVADDAYNGKNELKVYEGTVALTDGTTEMELTNGQTTVPDYNGKFSLNKDSIKETVVDELFEKYIGETEKYESKLENAGWHSDDDEWNFGEEKTEEKAEEVKKDEPKKEDTKKAEPKKTETKKAEPKKETKPVEQKKAEPVVAAPKTVKGECGVHSGKEGSFDKSAHKKLGCGHYACEVSDDEDHSKLPCGHYACKVKDGEDHETKLPCGHYACSNNHSKHELCEICGEYLCDGQDHSKLACGHYGCEVTNKSKHGICSSCGERLCNGEDHSKLPCGHYACDGKDHSKTANGYACGSLGTCSKCKANIAQKKCDACGKTYCDSCWESVKTRHTTVCNDCGKHMCQTSYKEYKYCSGCHVTVCPDCFKKNHSN